MNTKKIKYSIPALLHDVNGEPALVPYMVKLDLLDRGIPVIVDPLDVADGELAVSEGSIDFNFKELYLEVIWTP